MAYELDTYVGKVYYSECGVITEDEIYSTANWEEMLYDKEYKFFTKAELFWKINDWLVRPSREKFLDAYPEGDIGSLRIYRIEDRENSVICHFHIDALDDLNIEINLNNYNSPEQAVVEIGHKITEAIVDDDEIREFICVDITSDMDVPYGQTEVRERMTDEVFLRTWFE